jgi:hypothetical protein
MCAGEPVTPPGFFQPVGARRIVGEKALNFRKRFWKRKVGARMYIHNSALHAHAVGAKRISFQINI